jgi:hypothetical protein
VKNIKYKMKNEKLRCFFLIILCYFIISPHYVNAGQKVHKKFVYSIYWMGIKAGTAVMDYENSSEGITIKTHATSAPFISLFYKVDDVAQSILYPDGYPKKFILKIREGRHRRHKITNFGKTTENNSQKVSFHNVLNDEIIDFQLKKPAYDPLSAFYAITKMTLDVGKSEYIDIFDNKKLWNTEIKVLRKQKVRVPAGEFNTIVVRPLLQSEGIFLRKGKMHVWVTDDSSKIPVLFKSKAKIGTFKVKLIEADY